MSIKWNVSKYLLKPAPLSQSGTTALFFAAQQGHNDIVRFLFEFGASTEFRTKVREFSWFYTLLKNFSSYKYSFLFIYSMNVCYAIYNIHKPKKLGFTGLSCNDSGVVLEIQFQTWHFYPRLTIKEFGSRGAAYILSCIGNFLLWDTKFCYHSGYSSGCFMTFPILVCFFLLQG